MAFHDAGHGYDRFGLHPPTLATAVRASQLLYRHYFRVTSTGATNIPGEGAAILVANHSGMLPVDALMLGLDVLANTHPQRIPRMIEDRFIPLLPVVSTLFARVGGVSGTRANVRRLLEDGELLVIFPEGTTGVRKRFRERYRLQDWRVGHAELAIRHAAPVIPAAIVGAEESWPLLARLDGFHLFGAPYLPVPMTPLPLPARCHIRYGAPLFLHERFPPEAADDPAALAEAAALVRAAVTSLLDEGLAARAGVFR
jgi:1-acyl-sn-glycerol-3-phosphate acyltransferase